MKNKTNMSGWNYRIVRHRDPLPKWMLLKKNLNFVKQYHPEGYIEWFAIHEALYNKNGKLDTITQKPIKIITESFSKKEFKWILGKMKLAIDKPVIDFETHKEI